jgi:hypothetical protein
MNRKTYAGGAALAVAALLVGTTAFADGSPSTVATSSVIASPNQQQALDANQTVQNYILQHPDVTVGPTPSDTPTTVPPTTVIPTTDGPTVSPTTDAPTTVPPTTVAPTTVAPTTIPPTTQPASAFASGEPWSSGAYTDLDASQAVSFASARGRALDNISVFPQRDSWTTLNNAWYLSSSAIPAGFTGDILIAMPLWPQNGAVGTDYTAQWKTFATQVAAVDPAAIIRLGWENNIPGNYWAVTSGNQSAWIAAFNRDVVAMHAVAPGLRIAYNTNAGADQTSGNSRTVFQAVKANVWSYGIDLYDWFPGDTTGAMKLGGTNFLQDALNYAVANGKLFSIPEWGVSCNTGSACSAGTQGGGDNKLFIHEVLAFLGTNRANVAFESYFNETQAYIGSALSLNPNSSLQYKNDLATLAASVH